MSFAFDPEIAAALASMAGFTPPPVGDVAARRPIGHRTEGRDGEPPQV
jgi:hypothetical protein